MNACTWAAIAAMLLASSQSRIKIQAPTTARSIAEVFTVFPFASGGFYPFLKLRQAGAGPAEHAAHAPHGHKRLVWALVVAFMLRTPLLFAFAAWLLHGLLHRTPRIVQHTFTVCQALYDA